MRPMILSARHHFSLSNTVIIRVTWLERDTRHATGGTFINNGHRTPRVMVALQMNIFFCINISLIEIMHTPTFVCIKHAESNPLNPPPARAGTSLHTLCACVCVRLPLQLRRESRGRGRGVLSIILSLL